jgi:hypothetical protein
MLGLQTYFTKKKKNYKLMWHNMNGFLKICIYFISNHIVPHQFVKVFFKCVYKLNISLFLKHVEGLVAVVQEAC